MQYGDPNEYVPPFSLTIVSGGEAGQKFVFSQPEMTIGRIADNDLVLYDASVSRRHIVLYYRNQQYILEDLGSSNGTQLNGVPVTQPTVLCEQDILDVGSVRFRFSADDANEFDEQEDPTEIEQEMAPPVEAPMVRSRRDMNSAAPLPPEGDTRQFAAHQIQGANARPLGQLAPMPPSQTSLPSARRPQAPMPATAPNRGPGIQPPAQPLPSTPSRAQMPASPPPQRPMTARPAAPAQAAPPMSPHNPYAPQPNGVFAHSPNPILNQARMPQIQQQERQFRLLERRRVRNASLWSVLFFFSVLGLFLVPLKPLSHKGQQSKQSEPILLNSGMYNKVFGYNDKDQQHPREVVFQFHHKNGRARLSFRLSSVLPVEVYLNRHKLKQIQPTQNSWSYDRQLLPREHLRSFRYNRITFRRIGGSQKPTVWGLTQIKLEEQPFPLPDLTKAKSFCENGHKLFHLREKKPENMHNALQAFTQCQNHLALMDNPPPLYKTAALMLVQINRELDLLFHQRLIKVRKTSNPRLRAEYLRTLKKYFPDKMDPKHQQIEQLYQQAFSSQK